MKLPLELTTVRSFADELIKISMDAGARATLAGKKGLGQTYLVGGELPGNSPGETNFEPKIAEELKFKDKAHLAIQKYRDPTISALKGAGGAILLGQLLTGGRLGRHSGIARLGYRGFGAIGAGAGLADYYGTKKKAIMPEPVQAAGPPAPAPDPVKIANFISSAFTPARELSEGVQTGSFKKMIHSGGRLRPIKVGQKFSIPGEPQ